VSHNQCESCKRVGSLDDGIRFDRPVMKWLCDDCSDRTYCEHGRSNKNICPHCLGLNKTTAEIVLALDGKEARNKDNT
jgi:DnaJ-class molecular chaperone